MHPSQSEPGEDFVSNSPLTEAIRLVRLSDGRLAIEKSIVDPPPGGSEIWLNEILFYAYLRETIGDGGLHIPELLAIELGDDRTARLTVSYTPGTRALSSFESRLAAARAFGEMAAKAHVKRAFDAPWLPRARALMPIEPDRLAELEQLFDLIGRAAHYDRVVQLLEHDADLQQSYLLGLETVCHCDAHRENVRERVDGQGYLVIDWACASRGMIGHDLSRLAQPQLLWDIRWPTFDALMAAEAELLQAYLSGVGEHLPDIDERAVARCFELASASLALRLFSRLAVRKITRARTDRRRDFWTDRIRDYYDLTMARIETILAEHRSRTSGADDRPPTVH